MATLSEALKDKKGFPDAMEVAVGDGLKMTLGELRQFQDATGQDVARQLQSEREKITAEQAQIARAQEEVVALWTKLQEASGKQQQQQTTTQQQAQDWTKDPLFAPIAEHLKATYDPQLKQVADQIANFQKALGLGVKYIADTFTEMRYQSLPEDFRKETPYEAAVKTAAEKKYLDSGGVPDIRKVYDEWRTPREQKAAEKRIEDKAYEKARADLMSSGLARPSGMPSGAAQTQDPNAPKTIRESFQRLKEDPEFLNQIYNLTGGTPQA